MSRRINMAVNNIENDGFRQSMGWLHTWAGLVVGWLLYFIFITGTAGYFDTEIDRWMQPEIPVSMGVESPAYMLALSEKRLEQIAPRATGWYINLPIDRNLTVLRIGWDGGSEILHPQTGQAIANSRSTGGGQFLYRMHERLHYIPRTLGEFLVSFCAMFMLVALITGVVIHRRIFKDFFTFRSSKKPRAWLDMHNVLSVLALPFHFMITYSGLLFFAFSFMPLLIVGSYGTGENNEGDFFAEAYGYSLSVSSAAEPAVMQPLVTFLRDAESRWGSGEVAYITIDDPNDANARVEVNQRQPNGLHYGFRLIYDGISGEWLHGEGENISTYSGLRDVMENLHEGVFAGMVLRCLFFLSGLMGAGMIATGMILWATKRRKKAQKKKVNSRGLALVERLNVGTIVGLPLAIAIYFWANRLIPVSFESRADWEVHALFISWGLALIYPIFRSVQRAWFELLCVAALAYCLIPLLNFFTTNRHLGISIPQGDWVMAGFDLTMLVFGLVFAMAALKVNKKEIIEQKSLFINTKNKESNTVTVEVTSS